MDRNDIAQLAQLAKLSFTDEKLDAFTEEFSNILAFVDQLSQLDTQGVSIERKADSAVVREDKVAPSLPKQAVIELAPNTDGDGFLIPRIV
ncbi:MAG: Asp-tRNA(Asn)/Glu-tRNA(Gln) amidotransferase subunit GatC [Acutalibacteraceae bacterium]